MTDTVGAGDTFTGALMVALLDREATTGFAHLSDNVWRESLAWAAAAAALNCTRAGADPPTRQDLDAFTS